MRESQRKPEWLERYEARDSDLRNPFDPPSPVVDTGDEEFDRDALEEVDEDHDPGDGDGKEWRAKKRKNNA